MAGFADGYETGILNLILCAKGIANVADNTASSPATATWIGLHTADPGDSGNQATSELALAGYTRISVTRTTTGFAVASGSASPVAVITFPILTSTSTATITHASIGLSSAGAGTLIASGPVSPNISGAQNVTPSITTGSSFTLD